MRGDLNPNPVVLSGGKAKLAAGPGLQILRCL